MYFERGAHTKKKTSGKINIVQLGSNVTDYTILLELYNFSSNTPYLRVIGQKPKAIFSLNFTSITGCNHKSDYTMLRKQCPIFDLPKDDIYNKMDDVGVMAINRGIVKKVKGTQPSKHCARIATFFLRSRNT